MNMVKALYTILVSLSLALIFNLLFFQKFIGISVLIFAVIFLAAVYMFRLRLPAQSGLPAQAGPKLHLRKTWWLAVLIVFFALMPSIRASEFLIFLDLCAILGLLMLLAHELTDTPAFVMRFLDYLVLAILVPLRMLMSALSTITTLSRIHSRVKHRDVWLRALKGVIMAIPVLIIFGALFSQADLAFSKFIKDFLNISISELTAQYLVLLTLSFVGALSFLSYTGSPKQGTREWFFEKFTTAMPPGLPAQAGRVIEVMVFLGLISALFLLFIGFQVTYLFGGETNIVNAGFTYAEYARQGFWELLAVAILSLLVLLSSEKYAGMESKRDRRFLLPALILIVEVGVIISSAFKRLSLYIDAYGMTAQRFYAAGFIMLLSVLFILLAVKFTWSKREQYFVFGTLLATAAFLVAVNLVNPDALIAKYNFDRYMRTGKIDVPYIHDLSADAEPWNIELYKKLEGEDRDVLRELLEKQKENLMRSSEDWQSTNLSRARALGLLQEALNN